MRHTYMTLLFLGCCRGWMTTTTRRAVSKTRRYSSTLEQDEAPIPLYRDQGLFAVYKPLEWTSSDVVSYIRGILERDARHRGAKPLKVGSRQAKRNKNRVVKVGHGGTLDPLATGVLVIGVGSGTKELQNYLSGSKAYVAEGELGYETTTLDSEGNVTQTAGWEQVTPEKLQESLTHFRGSIDQVPPLFSAIRKDGKRMYEVGREGGTAELDARPVEVHRLEVTDSNHLPRFSLEVECGGGTYVRSLIRDIGYQVDSVATMTALERTKQGPFRLEDCLPRDQWDPDHIYAAIAARTEERVEATSSG